MRKDLALLTDFYELTMANSYYNLGRGEEIAYFDYFFRQVPDQGGYAIFAGLEQLIDYIQNFKVTDEEIAFLRSKKIFSEDFLNYLKNFKFRGTIYSFKEGYPIFPGEPVITVKGPIIDCQIIETVLLLTVNHQSLIATKASRVVDAAQNRAVMEFGARRAHSYDAANYGARAAYIAGVIGSSNTYTDYKMDIPAQGTMAHSYIQSFKSEYDAFLAYAKTYPNDTLLLVDTYDTLRQGVPNAIRVHNEFLKPNGYYLKGIRIDSGDLTYLTKEARKLLDKAGLYDTKITVSNSLDEYLITSLITQGAKIDSFGVGERLITARSEPVFGGVYKLVAMEDKSGNIIPKIKISDNVSKTTTPGFKQVYRFYDENNKAIADVVTLHDEIIDPKEEYLLFDPEYTWKQKKVKDFGCEKLLHPIFIDGKLVYQIPTLDEIRETKETQMNKLWDEVKRLEYPHQYYVDLSKPLWDLKQKLIKEFSKK
ncbi:MAG: nicotinate phosphoribosyltransferase [Acholeplasmataceae bacterium]|jgi:nicotinate phosphoribosyltransferase